MPDELVDTLCSQHRDIERTVDAIEHAIARRDLSSLREHIARLKSQLKAHFAIEEMRLYHEFSRAAAQQGRTLPLDLVDLFARNVESMEKALTAFFDRHGNMSADSFETMMQDWQLLSRLLRDRIDNEETTLYPLYEAWILRPPRRAH